jgi:hypothetical protein
MTTTLTLPRPWATNLNYSSGPDSGTPTKVDPSSDANGFIKGVIAAPQHVNYLIAKLNAIAPHSLVNQLLKLRELSSSTAITDTNSSLGVVEGITPGHALLAIKAGATDVSAIGDWEFRQPRGTVASITGPVCGAARIPLGRVLAIGTGGNRCCHSLTEGATWTAGANLGATPQAVVYNVAKARFMVTFAAGVNVTQSADGVAAWASVSSGLTSAQGGIAVLSNGDTFACGLNATPQIKVSKSSDGGATWAVQSGSPDPGFERETSAGGPGWICGNGGAKIYHVYAALGGTVLRVSSSPDGVTWTQIATLSPPGAAVSQLFNSQPPRIFMCQTTGLLLVVAAGADSFDIADVAFVSADLGSTWTPGKSFTAAGATAGQDWGVAGGRVFTTIGAHLYASDGLIVGL